MRKKLASIFICALSSSGCANAQPTPDIKADSPATSQSHTTINHDLSRYLDDLRRLDNVAARIFQANATQCQHRGRDPGVITHDRAKFPRKLRAYAKEGLKISSDPKVILVRKHGPASALRQGDILLGPDDEAVTSTSQAVQTYLAAGFLRVRRDGIKEIISVPAPLACAYQVKLKIDPQVGAKLSGGQIIVTTGLLDFTRTDSELAYVLGHELAHGIKNHMRKAVRSGGLLGLANKEMRALEIEADKTGVVIMARAGYDIRDADIFWQRMISENLQNNLAGKAHPARKERLFHINSAITAYRAEQN